MKCVVNVGRVYVKYAHTALRCAMIMKWTETNTYKPKWIGKLAGSVACIYIKIIMQWGGI